MKNQYFGDVNDYRKYGLLRVLAGDGEFRTAVCWMLTKGDGRSDGNRRAYLDDREVWRDYDPELFDALKGCSRSVAEARERELIPGARFLEWKLADGCHEREAYFAECLKVASGCELVFFDPDNGLEVESVPRGRKDSCKYLYPDELKQAFDAGHSVLVYQHYPYLKRENYRKTQAERLCKQLSVPAVWLFSTPYVLFLLVPQVEHMDYLKERVEDVRNGRWPTGKAKVQVSEYAAQKTSASS